MPFLVIRIASSGSISGRTTAAYLYGSRNCGSNVVAVSSNGANNLRFSWAGLWRGTLQGPHPIPVSGESIESKTDSSSCSAVEIELLLFNRCIDRRPVRVQPARKTNDERQSNH